jgi:DNA-directed RNA polymerase specialized sigma subunit
MGLFSRSSERKIDRLEKICQNLEPNHGEKCGGPFRIVDHAGIVKALTQIIDELPPQEITLFSLYYCEGLNFKIIGEVLGYSELKVIRLFRDGIKRVAS